MIALRLLTLLDFTARKQLQQDDAKLAGIYPGNPKRATSRPSAEMMLRAFDGLTLTIITEPHRTIAHINPLSSTQLHILHLLGFSSYIYLRLTHHFLNSTLNLSEP